MWIRLGYMKLNKTEIKGYNWLLSKGYLKSDITFYGRSTPDFITSDGCGWEVKLKIGKSRFWMSNSQYTRLKNMENTTVVVFDDIIDIPIVEIKSNELQIGKFYNGLMVSLPKTDRVSVLVDSDTLKRLRIYVSFINKGKSGLLCHALDKAVDEYIDKQNQNRVD